MFFLFFFWFIFFCFYLLHHFLYSGHKLVLLIAPIHSQIGLWEKEEEEEEE